MLSRSSATKTINIISFLDCLSSLSHLIKLNVRSAFSFSMMEVLETTGTVHGRKKKKKNNSSRREQKTWVTSQMTNPSLNQQRRSYLRKQKGQTAAKRGGGEEAGEGGPERRRRSLLTSSCLHVLLSVTHHGQCTRLSTHIERTGLLLAGVIYEVNLTGNNDWHKNNFVNSEGTFSPFFVFL